MKAREIIALGVAVLTVVAGGALDRNGRRLALALCGCLGLALMAIGLWRFEQERKVRRVWVTGDEQRRRGFT